MKNTFKEFYPLSDEEFKTLWQDCIFVFDANVLLNLYRYSQKTSQKLLEILKNEKIKDRVWMPHQFALEYQKDRLDVIVDIKNSYDKILTSLDGVINIYAKHPFIKIQNILRTPKKNIKDSQKKHPHWDEKDTILNEVTEIFKDKIGSPLEAEELENLYEEGEKRYNEKIPPGYNDSKKESNRYGDLIGWKQIINYSKTSNKPIILISDDGKDDWWRNTKDGQTVGPRYELKKEMIEATKNQFHMYDSNGFIKYASVYLEEEVDSSIVKEIEEITKKNIEEFFSDQSTGETAESLSTQEIKNIEEEDVGESEES